MMRSRLYKSTAFIVWLGLHAAVTFGGAGVTANGAATLHFGGPDASKLSMLKSSVARNAFVATLGWYGVESLETLSGQQNPMLTFGPTGVTAQTGFPSGVFAQYPYSVSGVHFALDADGTDEWLQFSQPVTAFGSYIVQAGDGASAPPTSTPPNTLTLRLENSALRTSKDVVVGALGPDWAFYNVIFVGLTDTEPFDRISFRESYDRDGLLWDDLTVGNLVVGDFDSNGTTNAADLARWQEHMGTVALSPYTMGDGDGDSDVDGSDLLVWQRRLSAEASAATVGAASQPVPEAKSTIIALVAAALAGGATRRAKK